MSQLRKDESDLLEELLEEEEERRRKEARIRAAALERSEAEEEPEEIVYTEYRRQSKVLPFLKALTVVIFILGFMAACLLKTRSLYQEKADLVALRDGLELQIEEEKAKALDYKVDKAYYRSDQYKEDMARNRFRLIYPGEVMISLIE